MNTPQEPIQPQQVDASTLGSEAPVMPQEAPVVADGQPAAQAASQVEQQAPQEQQVIEAVAEGLAEEEITAADIMTAVLSDSLGISPAGAQQLFQILMSELVEDVQEGVQPVQQQEQQLPPQQM